jgi:hypothetical protein
MTLTKVSQGAINVHQAIDQLKSDASKVSVAVTFGDPFEKLGWGNGGLSAPYIGMSTSGFGSKTTGSGEAWNPKNGMIHCGSTDFVCGTAPNLGGGTVDKGADVPRGFGTSHLSYSSDGSIAHAVDFIQLKIGNPRPSGKSSTTVTPSAPPPNAAGKESKGKSPKNGLSIAAMDDSMESRFAWR